MSNETERAVIHAILKQDTEIDASSDKDFGHLLYHSAPLEVVVDDKSFSFLALIDVIIILSFLLRTISAFNRVLSTTAATVAVDTADERPIVRPLRISVLGLRIV